MGERPRDTRVQWAQGGGVGVRSWAYHGIGRVHTRNPDAPWRTLCGVKIPSPSRVFSSPDPVGENDCARCARSAMGVGA